MKDLKKTEVLREKFKYSMVLTAVGDALGFPVELEPKFNKQHKIEDFTDFMYPRGSYSDDTQLTLAIARSIKDDLTFDVNYFAYLELPLSLEYMRGGGLTITEACLNILEPDKEWFSNIFSSNPSKYIKSGANGVVMRNLPIVLVNHNNLEKFILETVKNCIITHGHPRALLGAFNLGFAQSYLLKLKNLELNLKEFIQFLNQNVANSFDILRRIINEEPNINRWYTILKKEYNYDYLKEYKNYLGEVLDFNEKLHQFLSKDYIEYYEYTEANSIYQGSGTSSSSVAIYMFLKYIDNPEKSLIETANVFGSDTDTVTSMNGSLIGCFYGKRLKEFPKIEKWSREVQDSEYLQSIALKLYKKYKNLNRKKKSKPIELLLNFGKFLYDTHVYLVYGKESEITKDMALGKILEWDMTLVNILNSRKTENLENLKDVKIEHPTLKKGKIIGKIPKLNSIVVKFDIGQTVDFMFSILKPKF